MNDALTRTVRMGDEVVVEIDFAHSEPIRHLRVGIVIESFMGQRLVNFSPSHQAITLFPDEIQRGRVSCKIEKLRLLPGRYFFTLIIASGSDDLDRIDRALEFDVELADVFGTGHAPSARHGVFYQESLWSYENHEESGG